MSALGDRSRHNDYRTFILKRLPPKGQAKLADHLRRSSSWVSLMLKSRTRQLGPDLAPAVAEFLGLQGPERTYFLALVDLEEGTSELARTHALSIIRAMALRAPPEQQAADQIQFWKEGWYLAVILEMTACENFRPDPSWLAKAVTPAITKTQAARALTLLSKQGLLKLDGTDVGGSPPAIFTPLDLPSQSYETGMAIHRQNMLLASDAVDRFYKTERHVGSGVFALTEKRFDEVRERFRQAFLEVVADAQADLEGKPNRVYLFTVALMPVSDYTDSLEAPPPSDP